MNGLPLVFGSAALLAAASARRGSRARAHVGATVWVLIREWVDGSAPVPGVGLYVTERDAWEVLMEEWDEVYDDEDPEWPSWNELRTYSEKKAFFDQTENHQDYLGFYHTIEPMIVKGTPSIRDLKDR